MKHNFLLAVAVRSEFLISGNWVVRFLKIQIGFKIVFSKNSLTFDIFFFFFSFSNFGVKSVLDLVDTKVVKSLLVILEKCPLRGSNWQPLGY